MAKVADIKVGEDERNPIRGDSFRLTLEEITSVPLGSGGLRSATLTIKPNKTGNAEAVIVKSIEPIATVDGHITDIGTAGTGSLYFDLSKSETLLFTAGQEYLYEVKIETVAGRPNRPLRGKLIFDEQIGE